MSAIERFAAPADGKLDARMLAAFACDGFLVFEGFLSSADCEALRRRALELAAAFRPAGPRTIFSTADQGHAADRYFLESAERIHFFYEPDAGERPVELALNKIGHALHDLDPEFERISRASRLGGIAESLGLTQPLLLQSMYIFKQPHIGGEVDWHQDATFLHTVPSTVLGFWFAIDDAHAGNGCLLAYRGSHRGPLRRRFLRQGERMTMQPLDDALLPTGEPVALEVARGSLVLLHGLLLHASTANSSAEPRHAYSLHVIDGRAHYLADNWLQRDTLPLRGFT